MVLEAIIERPVCDQLVEVAVFDVHKGITKISAGHMAVDSAGDVIIAAYIDYSFSEHIGDEVLLLKYGPNGELKWKTYVEFEDYYPGCLWGNHINALAIDSSDNIYIKYNEVCRIEELSYEKLAKFNKNKEFQWNKYIEDAGGQKYENFHSSDFAVDGDGNIYISIYWEGSDDIPSPAQDPTQSIVVKYDANGNVLWRTYLQDYPYLPYIMDVAVDADGNVYLTGGAGFTLIAAKLDPYGGVVWMSEYFNEYVFSTVGYKIFIDDNHAIVIGGEYRNSAIYGSLVVKYDDSGELLWHSMYAKQLGNVCSGFLADFVYSVGDYEDDDSKKEDGDGEDESNPSCGGCAF
jgi:hypothetical protein